MAAVSILPPYPSFFELDGTPLNNGNVYIGDPGVDPQANPETVYWNAALTVTATQPIRTINGYFSNAGTPADVFVNIPDYSITVRDSAGVLIFTKLNYNLALPFTTFDFIPEATGAVSRNIVSKVSEIVSVKDFGAVGDAVTDDTAAFVLAEALSQNYIYLPAGTYEVTGLTLLKEYYGPGQIRLNAVLQNRLLDELVSLVTTSRDYYNDSGAANAYILTKAVGRAITSYENGMTARFIADNAGTGGATTVNIDGRGSRSIVKTGGGNPSSGDISATLENELVYDLANTRFVLQDADSTLLSNIFPAYALIANGYTRLKNGLIIQWGFNSASAGGIQTSFPLTYPTAARSFAGIAQNGLVLHRVNLDSTSQFTLFASSSLNVYWISVGH